MSPRTAEQFDRIRQEKKQLIMDTALELFAENGYHASSISQITKKAGISKGLVYNYFESKEEILNQIMELGFETLYEDFDLNHDGILTKEEFEYFIRQNFKKLKNNPKQWKLYFSLMLQPHVAKSFNDLYVKMGKPMFEMMYNYVVSAGSKDPEGDVVVISSMIEGAFLYGIAVPDIFPLEMLEEKIIKAIPKIINSSES